MAVQLCPRCEKPIYGHDGAQARMCLRGVVAAVADAKLPPEILLIAEGEQDAPDKPPASPGENLAHIHGCFADEYDRWNHAKDRTVAVSALVEMKRLVPELAKAIDDVDRHDYRWPKRGRRA